MKTNSIPGDFSFRGVVVIDNTERSYFGGAPSRVEFLRDVVRMLQSGQAVTFAGIVDGTFVLRGAHVDAPYASRRAATVAAIA